MDVDRTGTKHIGSVAPVAGAPLPSRQLHSLAGRVAGTYAAAGAAWILVTDVGVALVTGRGGDAAVDIAKGLLFVVVTTLVLWAAIRSLAARFDRTFVRTVTSQRDFYENALATSADVIAISDAEGRLLFVNDAITSVLGYLPSELVGRPGRELLHQSDRPAAVGFRERLLTAEEPAGAERTFVVRHSDGSFRSVSVRAAPIPLADDQVGVVLNLRDVTDHTRSERQLRAALAEDATGLPNLRMYMAEMDLIDQLRPEGLAAVIALVDVERFADVNQLHGRAGGDAVLRELARRLESEVPDAVGVWRHGADEFVVVLLEDPDASLSPAALAERIQVLAARPVVIDEHGTHVGVEVSVGVVHVDLGDPARGDEPLGAALMRAAESALLEAKGHPDRTAVRSGAGGHTTERARLLAELHRAVEQDELVVHYQPKVRLDDFGVAGVEALVRWQHPERGLLGPGEFLGAVDHANLGARVLRVVLDDALRNAARWLAEPGCAPDFTVCVNVSADDLRRRRFVDDVFAALERTGVDPPRLCLELTEQTMLADAVAARSVVDELRRAGVQVAIDDFGTGYSTLEHIRLFEVDELKIDRGFVERLGSSAADEAIVDSVLAISQRIGVRVVAEGIEHLAAFEYLRDRRCGLAQGYLFSRPVPPGELDVCSPCLPRC